MSSSFIAEMDKLLRRPAIWALGAVWAALGITFNYVIPYFTYTNPSGGAAAAGQQALLASMLPEQMIANIVAGFPLFGGAIALILGALVVGSEFGWGTLKTVLLQRPGRASVLSGKLAALGLVLFAFVLALFVLAALSSFTVAVIERAPVDWPSAWEFMQALGIGWFVLAAWAAFGAALAMLFQGTALAIGLGLVYVLVVEGLIRGFSGQLDFIAQLAKALPGVNAGSLVAALVPSSLETGTPGIVALVGGPQAALVLVAYIVGFVLLSGTLLIKRDVA